MITPQKHWDEDQRSGPGGQGDRDPLRQAGIEEGFATVDGLRIRYGFRPGVGLPLLLCNGIGANLETAVPLVEALVDLPVVLFDVPGTGGSEARLFLPRFRRYARMGVGVLEHLGFRGEFSVAGVSWGGGTAQQIARDYRDRVRHLILMVTTAGITMIPGRPGALIRMLTPQRYWSDDFMLRNAALLYGGELRDRPDRARALLASIRAPSPLGYVQQLLAMLQFSSLPWLHRIRSPALVMVGDDDPLVRPINGRLLARLIPQARLVVVAGGGHLFMIMRPQETAAELLAFLRS